jgi:phenylpropionate dioxygenase-like ring-hydroxylating dioxygenase large terminal subunit
MAAFTLPAPWYVDASVWARERRAVFGREWLFVGHRQRLSAPGDYVAADIAGWPLVVVVDEDGQLRAHHNVCRHRAGPLVQDDCGRVPSLVCRYHGWAYGLDGRLRVARDFGTCDGFDPAEVALPGAVVDAWRGLVFVNLDLDHTAPPLLEALGTFADECEPFPIEDLVLTHEAQHDLACNWKTYADNYLEGYHIPLVHPALSKEIDVKRYTVDVDEGHRWVRHSAPARDGAVNSGRWLWRWPNLALNLYPDAMNIERYDPVGPGATRLRYSYFFRRPDDREANDAVIRVSAQVTAEDVAICESVQRNLESGSYDAGWLSPKHEAGVAAFQRWVREAVDI